MPGVPAGLGALHAEHGRLPWARLVEPALRLARDGVELPQAHAACLAMLEPVMTMNEGATIYSPGGTLLQTGDRLRQPGLVNALELLADEGPRSVYDGSLGRALLELMDERGGLVTRDDLAGYEAVWSEPVEVPYAATRVLTRAGLAPLADCLEALPAAPRAVPRRPRRRARRGRSTGPDGTGDTTNLVTVDTEGNACVLTSSLGLGAGDWLPGLDMHLNSMLGESDLIREPLRPGERMGSMMSPTLALDGDGPRLRGRRRRRDAPPQRARAGAGRHARRGPRASRRPSSGRASTRRRASFTSSRGSSRTRSHRRSRRRDIVVRAWPELHHYFGGVSVVTRAGAAGDPRRSGAAAAPSTDGRPAEVAALGTPGVPRGRATAGGLRVDAGARQAANGLQHLQERWARGVLSPMPSRVQKAAETCA